jgi:hypothetical protein
MDVLLKRVQGLPPWVQQEHACHPITAAARWIMAAKLWSVLSLRMAMRLNSFKRQKKFSIKYRHL